MGVSVPDATAAPKVERIAKPWGEELILSRDAHAVVKALRIAPGQRLSLQYHHRKCETVMLLRGDAQLTVGSSIDQLRNAPMLSGAAVEIGPGTIHRMQAGSDGADILEIAMRLPDDAEDIVRLADDYGRAVTADSS